MKFIVLALAFIGAASAGFVAPLNSFWEADLSLGYGYGAGYYGLGATAYAAPAFSHYAAPALTHYAAPALTTYGVPAVTHYTAPLNTVYSTNTLGLTGYVAPSYGLDIWKKKKAA